MYLQVMVDGRLVNVDVMPVLLALIFVIIGLGALAIGLGFADKDTRSVSVIFFGLALLAGSIWAYQASTATATYLIYLGGPVAVALLLIFRNILPAITKR